MVKTIVKEAIIMLLVCLAILLVLCVLLYNYIPSNKILPAEVSYQASEEIQKELDSAVNGETTEVILSYEVTATDLKNYEKSDDYNAGKVNPFSEYVEAPDGELEGNGNNSNANTNTGSSSGSTSNSNTSSGKGNSSSGTYYPNGNAK